MKKSFSINLLLVTLVLSLASACKENETIKGVSSTPPTVSLAETNTVKIKNSHNSNAVYSLKRSEQQVVVQELASTLTIRSEPKDEETVIYRRDSDNQELKIKTKNKGFKVKEKAGRLRWKVKVEGQTVTISDNEENQHSYQLVMSPDSVPQPSSASADSSSSVSTGQTIEVKREATYFGQVKRVSNSGRMEIIDANGQNLYFIDSGPLSLAYAVLLLTDIPVFERLVIAAELWRTGR